MNIPRRWMHCACCGTFVGVGDVSMDQAELVSSVGGSVCSAHQLVHNQSNVDQRVGVVGRQTGAQMLKNVLDHS